MVLSIRTLEHQTKPVTVSRDASVLDLKHAVQGVFQIESNRQRLIFQGKMLKDGQSLTDYGKCYLSVYLYPSLSSLIYLHMRKLSFSPHWNILSCSEGLPVHKEIEQDGY